MPCEQLHLHHGEHQVKYIVQITRQVNQEQAEVLAESALSSCVVTLYPLASAEITRHEQVLYEAESPVPSSMRIRVSFVVKGMNGWNGLVIARFAWADGRPLAGVTDRHRDSNGDLVAWEQFQPQGEEAPFEASLFLPYAEMTLVAGHNELIYWVEVFESTVAGWLLLAQSPRSAFSLEVKAL